MSFLRLTGAMAGSAPQGGDLMMHGKKPTAAQRRLMENRGLDSRVLPKEVIRCAEQNPERKGSDEQTDQRAE